MQTKINGFFKPSAAKKPCAAPLSDQIAVDDPSRTKDLSIFATYERLDPNCSTQEGDGNSTHKIHSQESGKSNDAPVNSSTRSDSTGKVLNRKRSYVQYHLEFGQSDFLLHTCSVCGLKYTLGDEEDEKVHKDFHKNYHLGIYFKGWRKERVISMPSSDDDRIILVLGDDPAVHRQKVKEVVEVMGRELGLNDGWLLHKLCRVYLFISSKRIVGCLVTEPIKKAHRVISGMLGGGTTETPRSVLKPISEVTNAKLPGTNPTVLQFGNVNFQREVTKRVPSASRLEANQWDSGAILCEEDPVYAICGFQAIWVLPSRRRQRIATRLLDAARKSFSTKSVSTGYVLEPSQCAFSQPTSVGKALASNYSSTNSFLVYKTDDCPRLDEGVFY